MINCINALPVSTCCPVTAAIFMTCTCSQWVANLTHAPAQEVYCSEDLDDVKDYMKGGEYEEYSKKSTDYSHKKVCVQLCAWNSTTSVALCSSSPSAIAV